MSSSRTLISVEVATPVRVWNRTYLADYVPTVEQFECYYRVLCGFHDAVVTVTKEPVPQGFNEKLLKPLDTAPTVFPLSDLETVAEDMEKRQHYKDFIKQLVQMETNRISLNFFIEAPKESAWLSDRDKKKITEYRSWVDELMAALSEEMPTTTVEQSAPTVGWILAPAAEAARRVNGCRLIVNEEIGTVWENLLGTDHFPDLVVAQKLHTSSWSFQHEMSSSLFKSVLQWFLQAKNASIYEGVSEWMPRIDADVRTLVAAFLPVVPDLEGSGGPTLPPRALLPAAAVDAADGSLERAREKDPAFDTLPAAAFPTRGRAGRPAKIILPPPIPIVINPKLREEFKNTNLPVGTTPKIINLKELLCLVENLLAPVGLFEGSVEACGVEEFRTIVQSMCQLLGLTLGEGMEDKFFKRWTEDHLGFRPDLYPIIAEWYDAWRTIIRANATIERVRFFIKTVSLSKETTLDNRTKETIVDGWIQIFMDTHLIVDTRGSVQAIDLHEQCKLFCLQYVPQTFAKYFTPMTIGPFFTRKGFQTQKRKNGRYTYGIRYRRPDERDMPAPRVHITNTFQQTTRTEPDGAMIQHISSTTEINLGLL
jgi:hypothetical protein